jgi:hypothetical protein
LRGRGRLVGRHRRGCLTIDPVATRVATYGRHKQSPTFSYSCARPSTPAGADLHVEEGELKGVRRAARGRRVVWESERQHYKLLEAVESSAKVAGPPPHGDRRESGDHAGGQNELPAQAGDEVQHPPRATEEPRQGHPRHHSARDRAGRPTCWSKGRASRSDPAWARTPGLPSRRQPPAPPQRRTAPRDARGSLVGRAASGHRTDLTPVSPAAREPRSTGRHLQTRVRSAGMGVPRRRSPSEA